MDFKCVQTGLYLDKNRREGEQVACREEADYH